ncbi:hypothetical protein F8M41_008058 [Gigaspora margarita]|uniref:Uncharacterized protein n=1 Tax=Gigaspora margarita TaxID=4874 RepID=A0A8H4AVX3_GIGMA|nr:hypothetical protein F8M41_008058 [Gigaspora margarita]
MKYLKDMKKLITNLMLKLIINLLILQKYLLILLEDHSRDSKNSLTKKRKENPQLDNFLKQQEELQYYEENSKENDSEESEYYSITENFGRYPMTHIMTNEEHYLLSRHDTPFDTKKVTFFDQKAYIEKENIKIMKTDGKTIQKLEKQKAQKYFEFEESSASKEELDNLYSTSWYTILKLQKPSTMMRNPKLIRINLKKETEEAIDKIIQE